MSRIIDWQARATAIDVSRSFSVVAPAGSGKTELLTQRLLALLATVDHPEEVLAITFTRKAAEEMTHRLLQAMQAAAKNAPQDMAEHEAVTRRLAQAVLQRDAECGWHLLQNPNRLRLKTIDGFCATITKQLPLEARFGADISVADEPHELYVEACQQLLKELTEPSITADHLSIVLSLLDNRLDAFEGLLSDLLGKRDQWLGWMVSAQANSDHNSFVAQLEANIETLINERLSIAAERLNVIASDLCMLLDFAAGNVTPDHALYKLKGIVALPECHSSALDAWQAIADQLLTSKGTLRKTVDKRNGFPAAKDAPEPSLVDTYAARKTAMLALLQALDDMPDAVDALQRLTELVAPSIDSYQRDTIAALMAILPRSVAHLWTVFSRRGQVDYIEINRAANMALGTDDAPTDIALALDYRIKHILVDEFQDTSPPQLALLEKLTAGWLPDDGRTLFIVGDGMQSCYGFREANVGIFLTAIAKGIGHVALEPLQLVVNFRSQAGIIDWVNTCFQRAFPAQHDVNAGAVAFAKAAAQKSPLEGAAALCYGVIDDPDGTREAAEVVAIIQSIKAHTSTESIALLVRGRKHLEKILPALQAAGIPWLAQDIDPLGSRPIIRDMLSLYAVLNHPSDRKAWIAVLRSPLVGLSLQDLLTLCEASDNLAAAIVEQPLACLALTDDGLQRMSSFAAVVQHAFQQRGRFSPRQHLYRAWCSLHGPLYAAAEGVSVMSDVARFLDCIERLENIESAARPLSVERIELALKKLYASADTAQAQAVNVMTIHKSKGLEFDHVIIPGLDRKPRGQDKAMVHWRSFNFSDGSDGFFMAPLYHSKENEGLYRLLSNEKKRREQLESTRLLYVGVTRAIKRLHLLGRVGLDKKQQITPPTQSSLLHGIWATFEREARWIHPDQAPSIIAQDRASLRQQISPHNRRLPRHSLAGLPTLTWTPGCGATNIPVPDPGELPQAVGNLVHRALELISIQTLRHWPTLTSQMAMLTVLSRGLGIAAHMEGEVIKLASTQLNVVALDNANHWIFEAPRTRCEWRIVSSDGRLNIIDRVIWQPSGDAVVIDFKTSQPSADESKEAFIARESQQYRAQLEGYRQLLEGLGERVSQAGLYFTALGHWEQLL